MNKQNCIHDFIMALENEVGHKLYPVQNYTIHNGIWEHRFRLAGYISVRPSRVMELWIEIHNWCREKIGEKNYAWTGTLFWFENDHDAVMFALRWL